MRSRGQRLEHRSHGNRQAAQGLQLAAVGRELRAVRQLLVDQQIGDLLELAGLGDLEDVVAAIVKIVAGPPDAAERGVTGRHTGKGYGLLGFSRGRYVHWFSCPKSASSLRSYS